jgi:peptidoglycan/xylan/chitin deacetylase (PgdA/CDA1 family)
VSALLAVLFAIPVVLMYHRVDVSSPADHTSRALTVSPAQFAAELRYLQAKGLRPIGIDELQRDLAQGRAPGRAVLITFDDGYGDQFRYAFPILERYGDRAVFFVNTGNVGRARHLTWNEIDVMHWAGMSIECHGVDHVDLASLGPAAKRYEIGDCVRSLQRHLHDPVRAYAYPSGAFDSQTITIEQRAGLAFGFTTDPSFQTQRGSPYELARLRVTSGMSDKRFAALISSCLTHPQALMLRGPSSGEGVARQSDLR